MVAALRRAFPRATALRPPERRRPEPRSVAGDARPDGGAYGARRRAAPSTSTSASDHVCAGLPPSYSRRAAGSLWTRSPSARGRRSVTRPGSSCARIGRRPRTGLPAASLSATSPASSNHSRTYDKRRPRRRPRALRPSPRRGRARDRRQARRARARPHRASSRTATSCSRTSRPREDARRALVRAGAEHAVHARPVHARPHAVRRHGLVDLEPARRRLRVPARARSSRTSSSATRSTARRRRRRRRCSRRCRSAR